MKNSFTALILAFLLGLALASASTYLMMSNAIELAYEQGYSDGLAEEAQAIQEHETGIYNEGYFSGYYDGSNDLPLSEQAIETGNIIS